MSFDQSTAFVSMTVHVPVSGNSMADITENDPVDFVQMAQQGISGALSRNDMDTLKMLEDAMTVMAKAQKSSSSTNLTA
jgi:hypothetical protein